jgi:hypothetical protein
MEYLNRVLSGNAVGRRQLVWAAAFVVLWFVMDAVEFVDWAAGKIHPTIACKQ